MNEEGLRVFKLASQGFCCDQILLKMVLEDENKENVDLVRAVNGLCGGIAYSKKTCGALTGGICILGLYGGKGEPSEYPKENYMSMINEYLKWFEEEFQSTECSELIGVQQLADESGNVSYPVKCGDTIIKCYLKAQEIIMKYGYDYGEREE